MDITTLPTTQGDKLKVRAAKFSTPGERQITFDRIAQEGRWTGGVVCATLTIDNMRELGRAFIDAASQAEREDIPPVPKWTVDTKHPRGHEPSAFIVPATYEGETALDAARARFKGLSKLSNANSLVILRVVRDEEHAFVSPSAPLYFLGDQATGQVTPLP